MITIAWAPNAQKDDIMLAFSLLFKPWMWLGHKDVNKLEKKLGHLLGQGVVAFDSGRSALYELLKVLKIGEGDEVLLQAFTCVALPNPILWVGARPVYVDIDLDNFNIDVEDLERKITAKSKAIIIQYTFGIVPDLKRIQELCRQHGLLLIEDCCHNFGQKIIIGGKEYMAGTIGDGAMFSLGQEKVISATRGGFSAVCDAYGEKREGAMKELRLQQKGLRKPRFRDVLRGILNPLIWRSREKLGMVGEMLYRVALKLKLQELGLSKMELKGKKAPWLPYSMPNTNALLGLRQLEKLEKYMKHRKETVELYRQTFSENKIIRNALTNQDSGSKIEGIKTPNEIAKKFGEPTWLRYPIVIENAESVRRKAEKEGIVLGNWYTKVIHCKGVDICALNYKQGSCPKAEWLVERSINLPTHQGIGKNQGERIVKFLAEILEEKKNPSH